MFEIAPLRRTYTAALRDLGAQKPAVRASAAQDLGLVGDENPRAAADALAPLLRDAHAEVRSAALSALGTLDARHLLDAIAACLDDAESSVRQVATMTVAELGGERALAHLRRALEHTHPDVRYQALLGLTAAAPGEGLAASLAALASDDVWIASEAATQVGLLLDPTPPPRADPGAPPRPTFGPDLRDEAVAALAAQIAQNRGAAPGRDRVAVASAIALARLGDARAVPVLASVVRGERGLEGDDAEDLYAQAVELLGRATGEATREAREALAPLARRLLPSARRTLARAALARLDPRGALTP